MATAKPGPILQQSVAYAIGTRNSPPPTSTFRGSYNFLMLSYVTGAMNGSVDDADALESLFHAQVYGKAGLFNGEYGGGYAPIQIKIAMIVIALTRDGKLNDAGLDSICRKWYAAVLWILAMTAGVYKDSIIVIGPGSRLRSKVESGLSLPLQLTLSKSPRRFGINGSQSRQDNVVYDWKSADNQARELQQLSVVGMPQLARECGVSINELTDCVYGGRLPNRAVVTDIRSLHSLRISRYSNGGLAVWRESFTSYDAPHAGAVLINDIDTLQPSPIGPRAYNPSKPNAPWDHQWWCGNNVQLAWIDSDSNRLVAQFHGVPGRERGGDEGQSVQKQLTSVKLPSGRVTLDLRVDLDGVRVVTREDDTPTPVPVPVPVPTPVPPTDDDNDNDNDNDNPVATKAQGRAIRDALLVRMGRREGRKLTSDEFLALIEDVFKL